ncbi:30S ribosomal protein S5 [Candidatus Woesearchaeota archaeon]|nr:30S ribosomal protein S5 [Candidatus Woesearchaeota archaeon]
MKDIIKDVAIEEPIVAHPETAEIEALTEEAVKKVEEAVEKGKTKTEFDASAWKPKTDLGKKVKNGEITAIDEILNSGIRIMEPEIVDFLLKNLETDLLMIGQAKGKFGGGQRRVFRQTQKKTKEGNKPKFSTFAIVGNKDGFIGLGYGKAKETVPAREKAIREAKLNIIKIKRGNGSWQDKSKEAHSIPFAVTGKCGSVILKLMPAPKGTGLCVEKECQKVLKLAGIKNIWAKSLGHRSTKMNMILACFDALRKLSTTKISPVDYESLAIAEGSVQNGAEAEQ